MIFILSLLVFIVSVSGASLDSFTMQSDGKCDNPSDKYRIGGLTSGLDHEGCAAKCLTENLCAYFVYNDNSDCVLYEYCRHEARVYTNDSPLRGFRRTTFGDFDLTLKRSTSCTNTPLETTSYESTTTMETCLTLCNENESCVKFNRDTDDGSNPKYRCRLFSSCTESAQLNSLLADNIAGPTSAPTLAPTTNPPTNPGETFEPTSSPTNAPPPTTASPSSESTVALPLGISLGVVGVLVLGINYFYPGLFTSSPQVGPLDF